MQRKYPGHVTLKTKVRRTLWNAAALVLFKPFITNLFKKWRVAVLKLFGADISWHCNVYPSAKIWAPWNLKIGGGGCIGPNVIVYNQDMVILEENAKVSQYSYLCTAGHESDKPNGSRDSLVIAPILLKRGAWVGAAAFIGMGVTIGEDAIVGATASVFKDVERDTIVGGNPAKFIKKRVKT